MSNSISLLLGMGLLTAGGAAMGIALRKLATGHTSREQALGAVVAGLGGVGIGATVAMRIGPNSSWFQLGFGMIFLAGVLMRTRARRLRD